jgi:[citrate (pro-3S)-lyase] ligase
MNIEIGRPFTGAKLEKLKKFLSDAGLDYDGGVHFSVCLVDGDSIVATGSLDGNIFKCIAVREDRQGEDLMATILTELRKEAVAAGKSHLFLFTKPGNSRMFSDFGFYAIGSTTEALLMENRKNGARDFARAMAEESSGKIGAVVMNCNPFTLGHRYLVEKASSLCQLLYVFVLTEDRSEFPAKARLELVKAGTADFQNVRVHPTGQYMISSVTFPTYFIKDKAKSENIACRLDLEIFAKIFAKELGITTRFVGTEPKCAVTSAYNREMLQYLPSQGIEVVEIQRKELDGVPISASRVRELIALGELEKTRALVPQSTYEYIISVYAKEKKNEVLHR